MKNNDLIIYNKIQEILNGNTKSTARRINCKEMKESGFISEVFTTFDVSLKASDSSATKVRCKLQEILEDNTRPAIGNFHKTEISESGIINDMMNSFNITIKK